MLKIGVIGCGAIGREHIRRLTHLIPEAKVVACADYFVDAAKDVAEIYGIEKVHEECEKLIRDSEVEGVVITSADASHAAYVLEAVKLGKQVFCEKPLAITAKECEEIIAEELKHGKRLVQVGFMRRYDPGYSEMKKIIDSGKLGEPLMIHACHRNVSQGEGFKTEMGITNVAIHELDICRWLTGEEYNTAQVLKVKQSSRSNKGYDNPQIVLLETKEGVRIDVELQVSDAYAYDIQCQVVCEKGTINLPDPNRVIIREDAKCQKELMTDWADRFIEAYDIELDDWVKNAKEGSPKGPSSWDGYAACVAADALNQSRGSGEFYSVNMIEKPEIYK